MSRSSGLGKTVLFYLSIALLWIALAEIGAFFGYWFVKDDVDLWSRWRTSVNEQDYRRFLEGAYDPNTGWHAPRDSVTKNKNCLDQEWTATYDANGARVHSSDRQKPVQILVVGDSYAHGSEVNDDETFPAHLEQLSGVRVANHGIGGFGPAQALINLQSRLKSYEDVKVIIFSVMHGNIVRMANSFRPASHPSTAGKYGFKPYVMNRELRANPNAPPAGTWSEFQDLAREAFRSDFWSRGEWSFPYVLSWYQFTRSEYFYFETKTRLANIFRDHKSGYKAYYESDRLRRDLTFAIERFYDLARSAKAQPIVVFIPRRPGDLTSARPLIKDLRARFDESDMAIVDVGRMDIDWTAFNLKPGRCHPSPYGNKMIAESILGHVALSR